MWFRDELSSLTEVSLYTTHASAMRGRWIYLSVNLFGLCINIYLLLTENTMPFQPFNAVYCSDLYVLWKINETHKYSVYKNIEVVECCCRWCSLASGMFYCVSIMLTHTSVVWMDCYFPIPSALLHSFLCPMVAR